MFSRWQTLASPAVGRFRVTLDRVESRRVRPWLCIPLVWFVFVFPAIGLRGLHFEEGHTIALARGAVEDGYWLVPHHYGQRYTERPVLLSWLLAGMGAVMGGIEPWVARVPTVLSLLACCALVFQLVRQHTRTVPALFAAGSFLVSPLILKKVVTAEPDVLLTLLLFSAFVVWWKGHTTGRVTIVRWVAVGVLLAAAGLTKGPQPLAYFTLGVGTFVCVRRQWTQLPGFVMAHLVGGGATLAWYVAVYRPGDWEAWVLHSRLVEYGLWWWLAGVATFVGTFALQFLPGVLLAMPLSALLIRWRRYDRDELAWALMLFAACATIVLVFWPGARVRYAMPALPAVSALAGIAAERMRDKWPGMIALAYALAVGLTAYQIVLGWVVMPAMRDSFRKSQLAAQVVEAHIKTAPGTLYFLRRGPDSTIAAYLSGPIRFVSLSDLTSVAAPAWVLVGPREEDALRALRPDVEITRVAVLRDDPDTNLIALRAPPRFLAIIR